MLISRRQTMPPDLLLGCPSHPILTMVVATSDGGFVYSSAPSKVIAQEPSPIPQHEPALEVSLFQQNTPLMVPAPTQNRPLYEISIPGHVDVLSFIPSSNRILLQYFTCNASKALASHSLVHQEVCELILPMALENQALLYATLALAAIHRTSLTSTINNAFDDNARELVTRLTATSISSLRKELQEPESSSLGPKLATIRTLFLCEAISGSPTLRAWRSHFLGAKALLSSFDRQTGSPSFHEDSSLRFLRRWYNITEALVALTPEGLPGGQIEFFGPPSLSPNLRSDEICIDAYTGCAEDLSIAFREIGAVAWERRRASEDPNRFPRLSEEDFHREADHLELSVRKMIERDRTRTNTINIAGAPTMSVQEFREFLLCNEAYQQTALIHVHRRIRRLPSNSTTVQECVGRIIECVSSIRPAATLSPLTLLTTPLFIAGCEAQGPERSKISWLLRGMYSHLRLPNMKRALEVLGTFWHESEDSEIDWESFSRTEPPPSTWVFPDTDDDIGQRGWDFLPY